MQIKEDERALLLKQGNYKKMLKPGFYLKSPAAAVERYAIGEEFIPHSASLETVLQKKEIAEELLVCEVSDAQLALHFQEKNFRQVLKSGKHAFWKSVLTHNFVLVNLNDPCIDPALDRLLLQQPSLAPYISSYTVEPWQCGLLYFDKVFKETLGPGNYFYWKGGKAVSLLTVDLRRQQLEVAGQEIMTRDKIPLRLNFFCHYRITDVIQCIVGINDYEKQFYILLQLAVREFIGSLLLDEILDKKEEIGAFISEKIKTKAALFGIEILQTGIKDVILPGEIKDILNQVLIAEKKSQANVIMRREETASTRSLLNTAKLLEENKILFHLKELEYIERISEKISQISFASGSSQFLEEMKRLFVPPIK